MYFAGGFSNIASIIAIHIAKLSPYIRARIHVKEKQIF